jgi:hypothetical protein
MEYETPQPALIAIGLVGEMALFVLHSPQPTYGTVYCQLCTKINGQARVPRHYENLFYHERLCLLVLFGGFALG